MCRPLKKGFKMRKSVLFGMMALLVLVLGSVLSGCGPSDADVAAHNISVAAEQFEVARHVVAINGITDKYLLEVVGYCSVETTDSGLAGAAAITCKMPDGKFKKHYVYLSDNVTFVIEQIDPINV